MEFRNLKANEIDLRIAMVKKNGVSLLLYKDARVDMDILDETVGALNWKREHTRDNANCIVSIWDESKKQWISKEDTGTESFSEAAKGLASDSFKRACFNWGIGRELYTSPFVWIPSTKCKVEDSGRKDRTGGIVYTCKDNFKINDIEIADKEIIGLSIVNANGEIVFSYKKAQDRPLTDDEAKRLYSLIAKKVGADNVIDILSEYRIDNTSKATAKLYNKIVKDLK